MWDYAHSIEVDFTVRIKNVLHWKAMCFYGGEIEWWRAIYWFPDFREVETKFYNFFFYITKNKIGKKKEVEFFYIL